MNSKLCLHDGRFHPFVATSEGCLRLHRTGLQPFDRVEQIYERTPAALHNEPFSPGLRRIAWRPDDLHLLPVVSELLPAIQTDYVSATGEETAWPCARRPSGNRKTAALMSTIAEQSRENARKHVGVLGVEQWLRLILAESMSRRRWSCLAVHASSGWDSSSKRSQPPVSGCAVSI